MPGYALPAFLVYLTVTSSFSWLRWLRPSGRCSTATSARPPPGDARPGLPRPEVRTHAAHDPENGSCATPKPVSSCCADCNPFLDPGGPAVRASVLSWRRSSGRQPRRPSSSPSRPSMGKRRCWGRNCRRFAVRVRVARPAAPRIPSQHPPVCRLRTLDPRVPPVLVVPRLIDLLAKHRWSDPDPIETRFVAAAFGVCATTTRPTVSAVSRARHFGASWCCRSNGRSILLAKLWAAVWQWRWLRNLLGVVWAVRDLDGCSPLAVPTAAVGLRRPGAFR